VADPNEIVSGRHLPGPVPCLPAGRLDAGRTVGAFKSGDLVAFDVAAFMESRALPTVSLVFRPSEAQALEGVAIAKGAMLLSVSDTAVGKVMRAEPDGDGWQTWSVALPGEGQASIAFANPHEETVFLNYEDFLTPDSLLEYDAASDAAALLKSVPAKFDAAGLKVEQHFATSKDGTKVPYFLVARKDIPMDGTTPTLLYAYGGFQVSMNPAYSPVTGGSGWSRAGPMCWRISAAAASSARPGTRPA
jgi:prolyl oligopeptidase